MAKKEKNIKKRNRRTEAQLIEDMEKQLAERKKRLAEKAKHSSGLLEEAKVLLKGDPEWWSGIEVGETGVSFKSAVSTAALLRRVAAATRPWVDSDGFEETTALLAMADALAVTIEDLIGEEISKAPTKSDSEDEEYEDEDDDDDDEEYEDE